MRLFPIHIQYTLAHTIYIFLLLQHSFLPCHRRHRWSLSHFHSIPFQEISFSAFSFAKFQLPYYREHTRKMVSRKMKSEASSERDNGMLKRHTGWCGNGVAFGARIKRHHFSTKCEKSRKKHSLTHFFELNLLSLFISHKYIDIRIEYIEYMYMPVFSRLTF